MPATVGAISSRTWCGAGAEPSRRTLSHSMAMRKETTRRPEIIPIKMESSKNRRSSRIAGWTTPPLSCGSLPAIVILGGLSINWTPVQLLSCGVAAVREKKKQRIVPCWRAADGCCLDLRIVDKLGQAILRHLILLKCPARQLRRSLCPGVLQRNQLRRNGRLIASVGGDA